MRKVNKVEKSNAQHGDMAIFTEVSESEAFH